MRDNIEQLRKAVNRAIKQGWSINAIAKAAGVSRPSLQEWIRGEQVSVSLETFNGLCKWLGMSLTPATIPKRKDDE